MISLMIILISSIFILANKMVNKEVPLHILIVNLLWSGETVLAEFNLLKLDHLNIKVNVMIILFVLSFNICSLLMTQNGKEGTINSIKDFKFNEKQLYLINLIITISLIVFFNRIFRYLLVGDLNAIRHLIYFKGVGSSNELFKSGIEVIMMQWIVQGLIIFSFYFALLGIVLNKLPMRIFLWSLLNITIFTLITSGRMLLLSVLVIILVSVRLNWNSLVSNSEILRNIALKKKMLKKTVYVIVFFSIAMSLFRSSDTNIFQNIFLYLTAPLFYMSKLINSSTDIFLFGSGSISGLIEMFFLVIENLLHMKFETPLRVITMQNQVYMNLGGSGNQLYNAITTMYYPMYLDFGIGGAVVYGVVCGIISGYFYKALKTCKSVKYIFGYTIVNYILLMGAIGWELLYAHIWVFIIAGYMYIKTSRINRRAELEDL